MANSGLSPEDQQKIIARYRGIREELDAMYSKLGVIDADRSEHDLVIKQMSELDGDRRCWQQIGPVLAEKKVRDVLPILSENRDQLASAVKSLSGSIENRESELGELQESYGIRETSTS